MITTSTTVQPRRRSTRARLAVAITGAVVAALALAGCSSSSNDQLTNQYGKGTTQNYISGDGAVTEVAADKRSAPVTFSATTDDGDHVSSAALKGKVVVLNFWYAGCPPCRAEAKYLNQSYGTFQGKDVAFVGVNVRDRKPTAQAFERTFRTAYGSVLDADHGTMQLALSGTIAPNSVPTTIVLDKQGRVAARVLGAVDSSSIIDTLVSDELNGNA
ncbi:MULTISPECIES: TlpA disulfide reductase family protein [unclassified Curtobacterium]|uniref:TlpA family protein disulfide reductase n=1 Tax=unclassified Curtobacterium TaxID=257496 RepID=UPI0021ABA596|nr:MULTISPECIES: TlpA disulfide reductase family protein [unclassified Curtobacterium]WIB66542.1 TlpA disulfide reductase family protein [Curtobacterium sp. MCBD17_035]WIE53703.1 TlpA disulfide reductase family protein [Curtobacterium sp. MCBD17_003]